MATSIDLSFLRDRAALKRLALVTAGFAALGLAYGFLAPSWYRSKVTVAPVKPQRGGSISSLLGGELGGLAAGLAESAGGGADAPRVQAVLRSVTVSDAVIAKFDLKNRYGEEYQEGARQELWNHCGVKALTKPGLVELSCEDKDPAFVKEMLAFFAEHGNEVFRRVSVSSATEEVRFLERRAQELRQAADETSARMREFQEKYRVIDLESQSKAVVSSLAALDTQRITKQLELEYARTFSSGDEATLRQIESQLGVVERKLRDLEQATPPPGEGEAEGASRRGARKGVFPQALDVPRLRAEMEKLLRDRKVAEATLFVALERLESARASQARDVSTFQILDPPTVPTRRSRPKRTYALAIATLLGICVAYGLERLRLAGGVSALLEPHRAGPTSAGDDDRGRSAPSG